MRQQLGALKILKQPVESWDMILICILTKKLDHYTNRSFQIDRDNSKLPNLKDFLSYIENRATALETVTTPDKKCSTNKERYQKTHLATSKVKLETRCSFCSSSGHKIYNCSSFKSVSVNDRVSFIDSHKACRICLNNHPGRCKMSFRCSVCRKEHNSLLHVDRQTPLDSTGQGNSGNADDRETTFGSINENINNVLLPTVKVKIRTKRGDYITARGLLDTGSQISLVTSRLVSKLNLKTFNNNVNM
uniref:Uncharacterized protein LOC114348863 n=1 Tax=Diabrotica virgifera virgifera TaxID=50390 RepID=A0A6P7HHK7_DIAVI